MIEVVDRVPTHPGRVKLVPVEGQANTYDMQRADAPIEPGTPINKVLFDSIDSDLYLLNQNVANIINDHASLNAIGSLAVGTEVGIYENGILVPYIKVTGDYGGTGRSAVMRKNIYKMDYLTTSDQKNNYINGLCDVWLNTEFFALLDSLTQDAVEAVTIEYYKVNDSTKYTADRKVFLASNIELGGASPNIEGTHLPYFNSDARRIARYNGSPARYWGRSAVPNDSNATTCVQTSGYISNANPYSYRYGVRPMFTLPHDFEVAMNDPNTANVNATAEVI